MGWASGSELASRIIKATKKHVEDPKVRTEIYTEVIKAFEDSDWDTQDECMGEDAAFDAALKKLHPTWVIKGQP
jgi:hypothetical protein